MELNRLYQHRFTSGHRDQKARAWAVLYQSVFKRWIGNRDAVLDIGAGYCEFINLVHARRRIAVDLNPDTEKFAGPGVEVHTTAAADLSFIADGELDVVFSSNFLEHLPDKAAVTRLLEAVFRVLRPGGLIILMGPNVRLVPGSYWDFYDHHVALSDRSICELLTIVGFEIRVSRARFVPYTVLRWPLPVRPWLVRLYLALMPISSALFGQQFLVLAAKPRAGVDPRLVG